MGLPAFLSSCGAKYISSLKNETGYELNLELVKRRADVDSATAYQYSNPLEDCAAVDDPSFIRFKCQLAPGEEFWMGDGGGFISTTPFRWDSVIARPHQGHTIRITASSLPDQITDTSRYRCCGEGPLEIYYTVGVK